MVDTGIFVLLKAWKFFLSYVHHCDETLGFSGETSSKEKVHEKDTKYSDGVLLFFVVYEGKSRHLKSRILAKRAKPQVMQRHISTELFRRSDRGNQ